MTTTNKYLDQTDLKLLLERKRNFNRRSGPRVGDFVRRKDGNLRRFTHAWIWDPKRDGGPAPSDWVDGIQTESSIGGGGSFYLEQSGFASYSGGLDPAIPLANLKETDETLPGRFWFFHHEVRMAHNGVDVMIPCRVYEEV